MSTSNNYYSILKIYRSYEKQLKNYVLKRNFNIKPEKLLFSIKIPSLDILVRKLSSVEKRFIKTYLEEKLGGFENYNQIMDIVVSLANIFN